MWDLVNPNINCVVSVHIIVLHRVLPASKLCLYWN